MYMILLNNKFFFVCALQKNCYDFLHLENLKLFRALLFNAILYQVQYLLTFKPNHL